MQTRPHFIQEQIQQAKTLSSRTGFATTVVKYKGKREYFKFIDNSLAEYEMTRFNHEPIIFDCEEQDGMYTLSLENIKKV